MTRRLKRLLIALPVVAALVFGGVAIARATGGGDDGEGTPIGGAALDRAKAAALDHTGGGRVTATEVGDEEGYYEVEVTRADGTQVDVHLTRDFKLLGGQADGDGSRDDAPNDD
jgi:hypothetical protein